jgi:hypothetical protein
VLTRVKHDLSQGHTYVAIRRLRTYLGAFPDDLELRELLASIYRETGNLVEAGRWAFLSASLSHEEQVAFERANPSPWLRLRLVQYNGNRRRLPQAANRRITLLEEAAERFGPPPAWTGPEAAEYKKDRAITVPCLIVVIGLGVLLILAGVGVYRLVTIFVNY